VKQLAKTFASASFLIAGLMLSIYVQAAAMESELSKVTLFIEGMMKSRGGVT
jgi:hypothetical protein